jgi:DNA gyrase inhibitor GyrI
MVEAPTLERTEQPISPVMRALFSELEPTSGIPSDQTPQAYRYDKYTHEKSSSCICVIGGM